MARPFFPVLTALPFTLWLAMSLWENSPAWPQTAAATAPLPAGTVIVYHSEDQTLTVHVSALPLRQLLGAVTTQTNIHFRPPAPLQEFDNRLITRSFDRMPVERAVKQILGPSNTAMIYRPRRTATGRGNDVVITEVRVIDLGIIPITASTTGGTGEAQPSASPSYRNLFTPEQIQANRAATKANRAEKKQGRNDNKRGGQSNSSNPNTANSNPSTSPDASSSTGTQKLGRNR